MLREIAFGAALGLAATPALANDTMAQLGTGGLVFVRSDAVSMDSEDLFISADEIRVAYAFTNTGKDDVDSVVAFPMPDITGHIDDMAAIPDDTKDNFLDFSVETEGKAVAPKRWKSCRSRWPTTGWRAASSTRRSMTTARAGRRCGRRSGG